MSLVHFIPLADRVSLLFLMPKISSSNNPEGRPPKNKSLGVKRHLSGEQGENWKALNVIIPKYLHEAIKEKASEDGKTLSRCGIEALCDYLGLPYPEE